MSTEAHRQNLYVQLCPLMLLTVNEQIQVSVLELEKVSPLYIHSATNCRATLQPNSNMHKTIHISALVLLPEKVLYAPRYQYIYKGQSKAI